LITTTDIVETICVCCHYYFFSQRHCAPNVPLVALVLCRPKTRRIQNWPSTKHLNTYQTRKIKIL
jgi:hypothetical protein